MLGDRLRRWVNRHPTVRYPLDNWPILAELIRWPNQLIARRNNARARAHPSRSMLASRAYFAENANRVMQVTASLADDESRATYLRAVAFRQYRQDALCPYHGIRHQYLPPGIIDLAPGAICVDCGAFTGDTALRLRRRVGRNRAIGGTVKIVSFEPDPANFAVLNRLHWPGLVVIQAATHCQSGELVFQSTGDPAARVMPVVGTDTITVAAVALDDVPQCAGATFIKMDVEGAELDTLMGARALIERNRPQLAVCIYHSDRDMIAIAEWFHTNFPWYRLYVRHHSRWATIETVLYAVAEN